MSLSICLFGARTLSIDYGPSTTRAWGYKAEETIPWPQRPQSLVTEAANSLRACGVQWGTYRSLRWTEKGASLSVKVTNQSWISQVKREADFKVGSYNVASSLEFHCHIQDPPELQGTTVQSGTQAINVQWHHRQVVGGLVSLRQVFRFYQEGREGQWEDFNPERDRIRLFSYLKNYSGSRKRLCWREVCTEARRPHALRQSR